MEQKSLVEVIQRMKSNVYPPLLCNKLKKKVNLNVVEVVEKSHHQHV